MRFLLPIVSACLLSAPGQAQAQGDAAQKPAASTAAPKTIRPNKPASFFLEEITTPTKPVAPVKTGATKPTAKTAAGAKIATTTAAKKPGDGANAILPKTGLSKHFEQGLMMQSMGMTAHAITEYKDALKDDPKYISTYNNLAQCLVTRNEEGDKAEAMRLLGEAAKLDPNNVGTLHALGVLKEDNKDIEGAIAAYRKVLAIQPINMRAVQNLSELYFRQGKKDEARAVIQEAINNKPPEQQMEIFREALKNLANSK